MKKKFLVPIMALAMCFTIGYNYSIVSESQSFSESLSQLTELTFASAETDEAGDCDQIFHEEEFTESGVDYYSCWTTCTGDGGTCDIIDYLEGNEITYYDYSEWDAPC